MTARTVSYLKTTLLAPSQGIGTITPTRMQDLPDSFAPWDDPANASGLGAPAILRGTVSAYSLSGLTIGAGQSTAVCQANATVLQNAITYCANNNKFFEIPPGVYEINSATGLVVPQIAYTQGFVIRGCIKGTTITQYYASGSGAPILTVGDTTGGNSTSCYDISGLQLIYGASQTGLTNSTYLLVGSVTMSFFEKLCLGNYVNPAYNGLTIKATSGGNWSNRYADLDIFTIQNYGIYMTAPGSTGSHFDNVYIGNNPTPGVWNNTAAFVRIDPGCDETLFTRLNCEWGATNNVIAMYTDANTAVFDTMHVEGVKFTGSNPTIFALSQNCVTINGLEIVNPVIQSANFTGTTSIFYDWTGGITSTVVAKNISIKTINAGYITAPISMFNANGNALDDYTPNVDVSGFLVSDSANTLLPSNFVFDTHMPVATFRLPRRAGRYVYAPHASRVERAYLQISTTYTHYGQYEDAVIAVPASITGFTITLSNVMGATGNQNVRTGNTVRVRRMNGTAAGTLLVKDDAGTTLTTSTTAPADFWYIFNGTHYVTFTPVTS